MKFPPINLWSAPKMNPPVRITTERYWDYNDIADYLNVSAKTVANKIVNRPDFPRPYTFLESTRYRRWSPEEIIEWALEQRN